MGQWRLRLPRLCGQKGTVVRHPHICGAQAPGIRMASPSSAYKPGNPGDLVHRTGNLGPGSEQRRGRQMSPREGVATQPLLSVSRPLPPTLHPLGPSTQKQKQAGALRSPLGGGGAACRGHRPLLCTAGPSWPQPAPLKPLLQTPAPAPSMRSGREGSRSPLSVQLHQSPRKCPPPSVGEHTPGGGGEEALASWQPPPSSREGPSQESRRRE